MSTVVSRVIIFVISAAILFIVISQALERPKRNELPLLGKLPDFAFTNQRNEKFSLEDTTQKLSVFGFFFTRCKAECSLLTSNLERLATLFDSDSGVQFIAITVDPGFDTPQVLYQYSKKFSAHFANWHFLTAEIAKIEEFMRAGLKIVTHDDPSMHTTRLVLVDQNSTIRGYYSGLEEDAIERLIGDLEQII
jgi:protein SCO1/2